MKEVTVSIPVSVHLTVTVPDDATDDQIREEVERECPKYPEIKSGTHFDPADYVILTEESAD